MSPVKFFALSMVFVAIGIWMVVDPKPSNRLPSVGVVRVIGWLVIAFFGGGAVLVAVKGLRDRRSGDRRNP